jgi:ribosomal protein L29
MKPICQASNEMVEAFDSNKWEKLAPGKKLAPKSSIRLLQMSDTQYLKLYERVSEFLFSIRLLEERKKQEEFKRQQQDTELDPIEVAPEQINELDAEIQNLISGGSNSSDEEVFEDDDTSELSDDDELETEIFNVKEDLIEERFSLDTARTKSKDVPRVQKAARPVKLPELRTSKGTKTVASISTMFEEAENSEELLTSLLDMLVGKGPFEKSALIVISKDRKTALVVTARGPNIGNGQTLELTDPLSPLAQCFSKVQSWGNKESKESPFGSKAFALAPIDADHDTPVALYADCGRDGSITFEARRIFRTVVEILNQKLPHLPGGIPVELRSGK